MLHAPDIAGAYTCLATAGHILLAGFRYDDGREFAIRLFNLYSPSSCPVTLSTHSWPVEGVVTNEAGSFFVILGKNKAFLYRLDGRYSSFVEDLSGYLDKEKKNTVTFLNVPSITGLACVLIGHRIINIV